jgi:carbon monoxide dehydrogenase subunit G
MVWEALHDPDTLKECIRGCERLDKVDDRHMTATVQAKVGPVKATFDGDVNIVEEQEPEHYVLEGEGKGGVAGFAKGRAEVWLAEEGRETVLTYHAKATVGGKLAQLGSRLVESTAKKYAADFFSILSDRLSVAAVTPPPVGAGETVTAEAPRPQAAADEGVGRIEPTPAQVDEGLWESDTARRSTPIDSPHAEDTMESRLEMAAGKRTWGGPWFWGILAFAAVILLLIAFQ